MNVDSKSSLTKPNEKIIDLGELQELMKFYPTLEEAADWFNCSPDTIERRIKGTWSLTFAEFRKRFSGKTRLMIKRQAITMALEEKNEKMLLYCLRTMTDLDDREEKPKLPTECRIIIDYDDMNL
jgi:hypothetical protein